jgi:hypothetical protein
MGSACAQIGFDKTKKPSNPPSAAPTGAHWRGRPPELVSVVIGRGRATLAPRHRGRNAVLEQAAVLEQPPGEDVLPGGGKRPAEPVILDRSVQPEPVPGQIRFDASDKYDLMDKTNPLCNLVECAVLSAGERGRTEPALLCAELSAAGPPNRLQNPWFSFGL